MGEFRQYLTLAEARGALLDLLETRKVKALMDQTKAHRGED
jgi:hypothetical protein